MSNTATTTAPAMWMEAEAHWAFATLSQFDAWCGSTCHMLLRYVLRSLLVLALVGTFMASLVRTLDPKRRVELKKRLGLADASRVVCKSKLELAAGTFRDAGLGAKIGKGTMDLDGPDVKDSCAVM
ncbi:hypothetical protein SVAN01_03879 [Stagonosporopsis vannaccii]|nr:hypothetical protein SVAN01_03879 [Stagonosporopsis vannaccii]